MKPLTTNEGEEIVTELKPLKVLVIEDSDDDAVLLAEEIRRGGYSPDFDRVEDEGQLRRKLAANDYDIIVSDYSLPQFTALEALEILKSTGKDIPMIVVSGSVREATIVAVMRAGARDYVMKENLTRLPLAIGRELEEATQRRGLRQLEDQLRHSQRLESLGVLAGGVAHDFNNLLTGIMGNVSLAMEEALPESPTRPMLQQALQASEQAANLTRQMLAYAGKGKFFVERTELSALVRDVSALLHASVTKNIELVFQLQDSLPPVNADRGQIQQLLLNLVINAAESIGPEKPGSIFVATGRRFLDEAGLRQNVVHDQLQPGNFVYLSVCDTGEGIEETILSRIFDPFFTTKFTGRGLGLSAVMGIVRSHRGAIRVATVPGKGAEFTVFLPDSTAVLSLLQPAAAYPAPAEGGLILVVDDEETIRRTAKVILERRGFRVFLAESGRAGVEAFRHFHDRVDLVLLDLTMPVMSGNDVLRELRAIRHDVPVLMSSGYNEAEAMARVDTGEVAGFIQKPYTADQLVEKLRSALAQKSF